MLAHHRVFRAWLPEDDARDPSGGRTQRTLTVPVASCSEAAGSCGCFPFNRMAAEFAPILGGAAPAGQARPFEVAARARTRARAHTHARTRTARMPCTHVRARTHAHAHAHTHAEVYRASQLPPSQPTAVLNPNYSRVRQLWHLCRTLEYSKSK